MKRVVKSTGKKSKLVKKKGVVKSTVGMQFEEWFIGQFGKRPSSKSAYELRKELSVLVDEVNRLQMEMLRNNEWDSKWKAALYAWNVFKSQEYIGLLKK